MASRRYHQKRKEINKTGTSGCGSFVVAYFQPATSINRLHTASKRTQVSLKYAPVTQTILYMVFSLYIATTHV